MPKIVREWIQDRIKCFLNTDNLNAYLKIGHLQDVAFFLAFKCSSPKYQIILPLGLFLSFSFSLREWV